MAAPFSSKVPAIVSTTQGGKPQRRGACWGGAPFHLSASSSTQHPFLPRNPLIRLIRDSDIPSSLYHFIASSFHRFIIFSVFILHFDFFYTLHKKTMKQRRLSFWEIWNMSFGFLGIQFGFALQNANTSRIFQTLGAEENELPILWLAAPVTGLLIQPIIGYYSDRTWHPKWGRRRPYFAIGAFLASLALIFMPNSAGLWMAAGTLWIMDASINVSMEPFRAFVGDKLPPEQRTTGFAMQSFFIGLGAVVASALPWIFTNVFGMDNTAPEGVIPDTVKWSYYLGAAAFFGAVMWTVLKSDEYPPDEVDEKSDKNQFSGIVSKYSPSYYLRGGLIFLSLAAGFAYWVYQQSLAKELYVLSGILTLFGVCYFAGGRLMKLQRNQNGFVQIVRDFQQMPKTMVQLAYVQFFSWFALFAMWIYTTSAITAHIYGTNDTSSAAYNDGADWVTVLFAVYNGVAALVAFALPVLARKTGKKTTHFISLCIGGISLASIFWIKDPNWLLLPMAGIGMAWASILSIPYAMLANALPQDKMGYYMGIFNFFIVIPQIVAASILGFILKNIFDNHSIYAMLIGGAAMVVAGIFSLMVNDKERVNFSED
jgi:maltose/moltooligosaccharide transporter